MAKSNDLSVKENGVVTKPKEYMDSLRQNLQVLMGVCDMTMSELAQKADISYETLKSIIYSDSKDCKMSTAVALAKAFNISVDELLGCETIEPVVLESIQIARKLPDNYVRFVRWAIRYYGRMLEQERVTHKDVNVMLPECTNEGNILLSNNFELMEISELSSMIRPKVFMGIKLPCDNYMPQYGTGDVLLIANDRRPMVNEVSVIIFDGFLWLAKRVVEEDSDGDPIVKYYSIRDGKFRVAERDIDEHIGYVAGIRHP